MQILSHWNVNGDFGSSRFTPQSIVELPTSTSSDRGELDATPTASPNPNNRVSATTTGNDARWSAVSSLSPPSVHSSAPAATVAPTAASLQAVSQQRYGTGQQSYFIAPDNAYLLSRPRSRTLPDIQVSASEISLTPRPGFIAGGDQSGAPKDGEQAQRTRDGGEAQGTIVAEQANATTNQDGGVASEVKHVVKEAHAGEKAHESEDANEAAEAHREQHDQRNQARLDGPPRGKE